MAHSALPKCPTVEQPGSHGHGTGRGPEAQQERQARGPVLLAAGEKVPGGDEVPACSGWKWRKGQGAKSCRYPGALSEMGDSLR